MATLALEQTKMPPTGLEMSAWTPKNNKPFNLKLFEERFELIKKWFAAWSENQRWQLIEHILLTLSDKDVLYLHSLIDPLFPPPPPTPPPPVEIREDFTRLIPRFLSLKILSYLDPRSLCRASRVSWYWHDLCQQNVLWQPKCLKFGWFLPNQPNLSNPNTLWKRHYIICVSSMFWIPPKSTYSPILPQSQETQSFADKDSTLPLPGTRVECQPKAPAAHHTDSPLILPLWKHPCRFPKDLVMTSLSKKRPSQKQQLQQSKRRSMNHKAPLLKSPHELIMSECTSSKINTSSHSDGECNEQEKMKDGSVPIHSILDPVLIEKMRLQEPSEHCIDISTTNNDKMGKSLANIVECFQEDAPFPRMKPYYVQALENPVDNTAVKQQVDSGDMLAQMSALSHDQLHIGQDISQQSAERKSSVTKENTEIIIREWADEDFENNSSESDIF